MTNKFVAVVFLAWLFASPCFSQDTPSATETKKHRGMPDIPGTFTLEFGFNRGQNSPDTFDLGFWGSRTLNIYYQLDKQILKSKFSFHPGVGFGMERYKFRNFYTLGLENENTVLVPAYDTYPLVRKSMLITNYFDILAEIRFSTNPNDPGRSFRASIGGRAGYLFDSFTKIKYKENGEVKKVKDKQNYNLNDFRYGTFVKIGAGNFTVFGYYNMSPLFKKDKGPEQTEMSTFTIGISVSSF